MDKKIRKYIVTSDCYIDKHFHVDHSNVDLKQKETLAVIGGFFENKPICVYCINRLSVVADAYASQYVKGDSTKYGEGTIPGDTTISAGAFFTKEDLINRSPLRVVFKDLDLPQLKRAIDNHIYPVQPDTPIRTNVDSEIARLRQQDFDSGKRIRDNNG